jgi:CO dehydrogenase/acetyl-CoA synthase beta subunit
MSEQQEKAPDLGRLIDRVREILKGLECEELIAASPHELSEFRARVSNGSQGGRRIVLAEETAVELGSPGRASVNVMVWTDEPGRIQDGRVTLIGPDLSRMAGSDHDYAQVVMLEVEPDTNIDVFRLETVQYLSGKVPGMMARMIPGRLWIRISERAMEKGHGFDIIGGALRETYLGIKGVAGVESVFVTRDRETVERFSAVASEAKILTGRHKKIALGVDGDYECDELNCESCDDKEVCDDIREVVVIRRRKRREAD